MDPEPRTESQGTTNAEEVLFIGTTILHDGDQKSITKSQFITEQIIEAKVYYRAA